MIVFITLVSIFLLMVFAGLCSAAETAMTAASRMRLHQLVKKNNARAQLVVKLQDKIGQSISTILLANTWSITTVAALATGLMTEWFGSYGAYISAGVMGILLTLYAEVTPKIYAYSDAERMAIKLAPMLSFLVTLLSPVTKAMDIIARYTLRAFGVIIDPTIGMTSTVEELRGAIDLHAGPSKTVKHERAMLRSILDLADVEVTEIMIHRKSVFMVDIDQPIKKTIAQILSAPYTRIPLWRDEPDNIVGILHMKALLRAMGSAESHDAIDLTAIAAAPWFVPESTTLFSQLQNFRERHEHFALVVDEYGVLEGIITLEDILEEIVGEIVDEHDIDLAGVRLASDGTYLVDGTATIRDLNRQFEWELPDEKASTIAGFILNEAKRIPKPGEKIIFNGLEIEVLRRSGTHLKLLRVRQII